MTDKNIFEIASNDAEANQLMEKVFYASKTFNDTLFSIKYLIENRCNNKAPGSMIELLYQLKVMAEKLIVSAEVISDFGHMLAEVKALSENDSVEAEEAEAED